MLRDGFTGASLPIGFSFIFIFHCYEDDLMDLIDYFSNVSCCCCCSSSTSLIYFLLFSINWFFFSSSFTYLMSFDNGLRCFWVYIKKYETIAFYSVSAFSHLFHENSVLLSFLFGFFCNLLIDKTKEMWRLMKCQIDIKRFLRTVF